MVSTQVLRYKTIARQIARQIMGRIKTVNIQIREILQMKTVSRMVT